MGQDCDVEVQRRARAAAIYRRYCCTMSLETNKNQQNTSELGILGDVLKRKERVKAPIQIRIGIKSLALNSGHDKLGQCSCPKMTCLHPAIQ